MGRSVFATLWAIASLYLATGAWVELDLRRQFAEVSTASQESTTQPDQGSVEVEGVRYASYAIYDLSHKIEQAHQLFPWFKRIPELAALMLAAGAFGSLGVIIGILKARTFDGTKLLETPIYTLTFPQGLYQLLC